MSNNETEQRQKLDALTTQIQEIKLKLSSLHQEKEKWFAKRAQIGSQIASLIRDVKEKRVKRDELTQKVQQEKEERRNYSKEIRDRISEVKKLREQRTRLQKRLGIKSAPKQLKSDINRLEFKLETEPMPYKEEQRLTKLLKDKRAEYEKIRELDELTRKIKRLSKLIDKLKEESDVVHKTLKEQADVSQDFHEEVVGTSKAIDELKKQEDEAFKKFSEYKDLYAAKRAELQNLIDEANKIRDSLGIAREEADRQEKRKIKAIAKKKAAEVEQKVKKGGKITTEDILAFQATD